jgi:hypothetical protein
LEEKELRLLLLTALLSGNEARLVVHQAGKKAGGDGFSAG